MLIVKPVLYYEYKKNVGCGLSNNIYIYISKTPTSQLIKNFSGHGDFYYK